MADANVDSRTAVRGKSVHPSYMVMVKEAVTTLRERNGSSRQKITKFVISHHPVSSDLTKVNHHVSNAIKKGVTDGVLIQTKGSGATGSFKIAKAGKQAAERKTSAAGKENVSEKKKRVVSKAKKASTNKTPSAAKKRVNRMRMSTTNPITAVVATPKSNKTNRLVAGTRFAQPLNDTYRLSLSEEESQDDLAELSVELMHTKPLVTRKTTPGRKLPPRKKVTKPSPKAATATESPKRGAAAAKKSQKKPASKKAEPKTAAAKSKKK